MLTEGVTYCDYGQDILVCKPKKEMFQKAMMEAGVTDNEKCLFVDDSYGMFLCLLGRES
jgi:pyrimidine and pyridine-specific 5'-nucleotidase